MGKKRKDKQLNTGKARLRAYHQALYLYASSNSIKPNKGRKNYVGSDTIKFYYTVILNFYERCRIYTHFNV